MIRPGVVMVTGAYPPEMSGAALQCRALLGALGDRVDAAVLTTTLLPNGAPTEVDGVPVHRVPVHVGSRGSEARAAAALAVGLVRLVRRRSIVHFHGFSRKSVLLLTLARALSKRRVVKLTSVGHDDPVSVREQGRVSALVYGSADVFVTVSPRQRELCLEAGVPSPRIRVIPNGVDLARFRPSGPERRRWLRRALSLPETSPVTLFVGFFSDDKQPHVLFEAWRRLGTRAGTLVFVGATRSRYYEVDATLADRIRADAASFGNRVVFVERADAIEEYYGAADVFALPSRREGLPNALLEAMASGLGCVASHLPGVTDALIQDGVSGSLVPPGEPLALARALDALLADSTMRERFGAAARATVARGYDLETTAVAYLDLYQTLNRLGHAGPLR